MCLCALYVCSQPSFTHVKLCVSLVMCYYLLLLMPCYGLLLLFVSRPPRVATRRRRGEATQATSSELKRDQHHTLSKFADIPCAYNAQPASINSNPPRSIYIYIYIYIYTYTYIYIYTHTHIYIHMYMYIHIYIYICTYMHACMHACMHTYIHTYIHTYLHTYHIMYRIT